MPTTSPSPASTTFSAGPAPLFREWPKIARFSRDVIITEKIDGTNASIFIDERGTFLTGSRTRWITPADDNFGFSRWAHAHREELMLLGPGHHFGEWWGAGIQRGYGLAKGEKRFSLFNVSRWRLDERDGHLVRRPACPACCDVVPVLWRGSADFLTTSVPTVLDGLLRYGSVAAPGFLKPEGIVIFHTAANLSFKKTLENDESPKSLVPSRV